MSLTKGAKLDKAAKQLEISKDRASIAFCALEDAGMMSFGNQAKTITRMLDDVKKRVEQARKIEDGGKK